MSCQQNQQKGASLFMNGSVCFNCRQQSLKAQSGWQLEFRRGLPKSVDGQEGLGSGHILSSARGFSGFSISKTYV